MTREQEEIWHTPTTYLREVVDNGCVRWMLFDGEDGSPLMASELEYLILTNMKKHNLPRPETIH